MAASYFERCEQAFASVDEYEPDEADWLEGTWSGLEPVPGYAAHRGHTEVAVESLREIGTAITTAPEGLNVNRKILRQRRLNEWQSDLKNIFPV